MWPFREIVVADTEYEAGTGERPVPVCAVAKELRSGRIFRIFADEFGNKPPWATGPDVLFVAFYAPAEFGVFRALGWKMPERIVDLYAEFKNLTSGLPRPHGSSLLGVMTHYGMNRRDGAEKKAMQQALGSGTWRGTYTRDEILDYCEHDVHDTERLLLAMMPLIDLPRALLRGRYAPAVASMEYAGVPIDTATLARLRQHWTGIQDKLIAAIDSRFNVYGGRSFRADRFQDLLVRLGIPWPQLESGRLDLSDGVFRQMAKGHPVISPLRELRSSLSDLRLESLSVGRDGRNRTLLSPFASRTGRNQPSNSRFVFGPSVWIRSLIQPPPGFGLAYIDWAQQEFAIAAVLSGDEKMLRAYTSGDCYLAFGKDAGLIPADATKASHKFQRELCKQCILGIQYGMEAASLALRIGQPTIVARDLLRAHHETYPAFWSWSDGVLDRALLTNKLHTVFGWCVHLGGDPNPRSLRNFPMQGHGGEMMRIAACLGTERGVEICAPVHDAFLICAPLDRLDEAIGTMRAAMAEASRAVLCGFEVRTDVAVIRPPGRFEDERGAVMWQHVTRLVDDLAGKEEAAA
jgi:DNA polymerase I-like protein with 3'-5' exonuclease and polymerase domains